MNDILTNALADVNAVEIAKNARLALDEKEKKEKDALRLFQLKSVADLTRSQIQFVSTDIRKMQTLRRFDQEYQKDRQWLKDLKRSYVAFLNTLLHSMQRNINTEFEPMQRLREIMDSNTLDVNVKYFGK